MSKKNERVISGVSEKLIDVVVIEDDAHHREMLVATLSASHCFVRSAATARDGYALVLAKVPDVVVSDLDLGEGLTGWGLAERLREDELTRHVVRIAVTGQVEPRLEVVRAFDAYLRKPVDARLLIDLVRELTAIARGRLQTASARGA